MKDMKSVTVIVVIKPNRRGEMCVPVVSAALECRAGWAVVSLLWSSSQKLSVQIPSNCPPLLLESVYIEYSYS